MPVLPPDSGGLWGRTPRVGAAAAPGVRVRRPRDAAAFNRAICTALTG